MADCYSNRVAVTTAVMLLLVAATEVAAIAGELSARTCLSLLSRRRPVSQRSTLLLWLGLRLFARPDASLLLFSERSRMYSGVRAALQGKVTQRNGVCQTGPIQ